MRLFKQFLLVLLLFSVTLQLSAQNSQRFTISFKEISLQEAMKRIEKITKYTFFYDAKTDIKQLVSLSVVDAPITEVVEQMLRNTAVGFEINNQQIALIPKDRATPSDKGNPKKVTGKVSDSTGEPLIGVNVSIKGTTVGTVTDVDGLFSLDAATGDVLNISFIGFEARELPIKNQSDYAIILNDDLQALDEVVVVGYGTQKKVNLTGAVGIADGKVLENRPIGNIAQGLQGVVPNLNINFESGNPSAKTTFNVRGATSLNGGQALLLVDGVEMDDLSLLNPQDIESVSVLKDASSASIYGARAAFGVVLITTKRGKKDQKMLVSYNNNFSWSGVANMPSTTSSDKWIRAINQCGINDGAGPYFSDKLVNAIDAYVNGTGPSAFMATDNSMTREGQWAYAGNTDWLGLMYQPGFMQQHNASLSGGSEKSQYYGSLGYKKQDGVLAYGTDKYERFNFAFNFTTQVTNWLELSLRTKYNRNSSNNPNAPYMGTIYFEGYRSFPYIPMYLPNGQDFAGIAGSNFNYNILGRLALAGRDKISSDDFWYTGAFKLTPFKDFTIQGDYTENRFFKEQTAHTKTIYQAMPEGSPLAPLSAGSPNKVERNHFGDVYRSINVWADYIKSFNDTHNLGVKIGYNQESKKITKLGVSTNGLFDNNFPVSDLANNYNLPDEQATVWAVQGAFVRVNYDYKQRYLLELNGRYDGSSKYMEGSRWGFFPSFSAGWRISEENFFEPARNVFDNLKIRVSYGSLGNQVTDGNFQYLSFLDGEALNYVLGGKVLSGLKPPTLSSANITWEGVNTANVGLDWGLLNSRLSGSFDYYIRNTNGMVVSKDYPAVLGTKGGKENLADMRTNGWELTLAWHDVIKDVAGSPFDYSIAVSVYDNTSKITKYDNPTGFIEERYVGEKIGDIWGYVTDGFIKDDAEAQRMGTVQNYISATWKPGDIRYKDLDGNGVINDGNKTLSNSGDRKVIGNNTPRYNFNINLGAAWKNFDLRVLFQGTAKRDIWLDSPLFWGYQGGVWQQNVFDYHIDNSWSPTNIDAYYPIPTWGNRSKQAQTKYLQNGAFIRLKDLTLSYTVPKALTSKICANQLKVYFSGQNLWEATGLFKYLDPDIVGARKDDGKLSAADGGRVYPFTRSYSFGINVTF